MMMRTTLAALAMTILGFGPTLGAETPSNSGDGSDARVFELRTYTTAPGKLDVLLDRFGETNLPLFEKHGIDLVGAWTPLEPDEKGDRLVYLVSFPSRDAARSAWEGFSNDPEWKRVFGNEKKEHGQVVTQVENVFLKPTDYSPEPAQAIATAPTDEDGRVYELRRYTASPGKLGDLDKRFREHTIDLFSKHGMSSLLYTHPVDENKGAGNTLVYVLAHPSREKARDSWQSFLGDPEWQKVYRESQADGVKLAAEVERTFLKPTAFSPMK